MDKLSNINNIRIKPRYIIILVLFLVMLAITIYYLTRPGKKKY